MLLEINQHGGLAPFMIGDELNTVHFGSFQARPQVYTVVVTLSEVQNRPASALESRRTMRRTSKSAKSICVTSLLLAAGLCLATPGCHYDRQTAGHLGAEDGEGQPGSTNATKEGTGDPHVGSGQGQVGTDAPPRSKSTEQPTGTGEKGDATGGRPQ